MTQAIGQLRIVTPDGILTPEGLQLFLGLGVLPTATAAQIADIAARVNTTGKQAFRPVYDTTNARIMVAQGGKPDDDWTIADGSASVTPA